VRCPAVGKGESRRVDALAVVLSVLASGCVAPLSALTRSTALALTTSRFEVKSLPEAHDDEVRVLKALEVSAPKLQRWGGLEGSVTVKIAPSHEELTRAVDRTGYDWLRAWARYDELIVQAPGSWARTPRDVDELMVHELTHCLLFQRSGTKDTWASKQIPLWFREGMATVTADQGFRYPSLEDLADFLRAHPQLDLFAEGEALSRDFYEAVYGFAHHALRFLLKREGDQAVIATMAAMQAGASFPAAFEMAVGRPVKTFQADFLSYVRLRGFRGFGLKPRREHPR